MYTELQFQEFAVRDSQNRILITKTLPFFKIEKKHGKKNWYTVWEYWQDFPGGTCAFNYSRLLDNNHQEIDTATEDLGIVVTYPI